MTSLPPAPFDLPAPCDLPQRAPAGERVAIFCRVIDNLGDAGVCWRLARQLATEHDCQVALYIDAPAVLARLLPVDASTRLLAQGQRASVERVDILAWPEDPVLADWRPAQAAELLIAAFGCELPPTVRARLARDPPAAARAPPTWIDLEYLSAEPWIDDANWVASIKPADRAREHFVFPGFSERSAGLLRERGLLERRDAFRAGGAGGNWLRSLGVEPAGGALRVSLFAYDTPSLDRQLADLSAGPLPLQLLVPQGVATGALTRLCGHAPAPGEALILGRATVHGVRWLTQAEYDWLLWSCDLNLVRGEDSWIRAHWAARPLLWQPYPQAEGAHLRKLDAWLDRLLAQAPPQPARAIARCARAWAGAAAVSHSWAELVPLLTAARSQPDPFERFSALLAGRPDLASRLLQFHRSPAARTIG